MNHGQPPTDGESVPLQPLYFSLPLSEVYRVHNSCSSLTPFQVRGGVTGLWIGLRWY